MKNDEIESMINEMLKGIKYIVDLFIKNTTKIYEGIILSNNNDGRWNIQYNGEIHPIKPYGSISPSVGNMVKVIVPQGNQAIAFFI